MIRVFSFLALLKLRAISLSSESTNKSHCSRAVSQFKVGHFVMWLPLFKFGGISGFQCLFSVLIFGVINASAMCHLGGVPSVVNLVAYRVLSFNQ